MKQITKIILLSTIMLFAFVAPSVSQDSTVVIGTPMAVHDTIIPALVDSSFIMDQINKALTNMGQKGVDVFGIHTTWFVFITSLLVIIGLILELITRAVPGLKPFNKMLGDGIKYINEHWNKK